MQIGLSYLGTGDAGTRRKSQKEAVGKAWMLLIPLRPSIHPTTMLSRG